jgi:hypothetical protein
MASVHEQLTAQFYAWEKRGRGWEVFPEPVIPEPPFLPFNAHHLPESPVADDGRRHTFVSSLVQKLRRALRTDPLLQPVTPEADEEPEPIPLIRSNLVELQTSLPADLDIEEEALEQFLLNLSLCREPVAFELLGVSKRVTAQFVACTGDVSLIRRRLQAYFTDAAFLSRQSTLEETWITCTGEEELVIELGLAREFMFPLANGKLDPFIGIIDALSELQPDELGLFQVIFQKAHEPWADSILSSVSHADGKPFFVNTPELTKAAERKTDCPIFAAVVRIAIKAPTFERVLEIAQGLAGSLRVFANPHGNELIPLTNDEYPFFEHIEDVWNRQSRRSGMLLNSEELIGFVHLPGSAVRSSALERDSGKTKAAPTVVQNPSGILLGHNLHQGQTIEVRLTPEQRTRHCHLIGASGTGKSTLLFNLIRQDIESGQGVAILDPHGDLVDKVLGIIPQDRIQEVVLVDPSDDQYSVGFNILSAHTEHEKTLLASDLVSVFQRLSTSWGDQMQSVLQNAILAFLDSSKRDTLADLRRFLIEPAFRADFLKSVSDPNVLYYWHKGFAHLSGNKSIGPVLTRLEMFLAQRPIAHMVSQPENRLDFGDIMDSGKIFLAKLPEGLLGKENSYLLGALLVSKFQQLAMSRQAKQVAARRDYWIYIDEFANFITPTMAEILSGARKYRIGLTLAHHELHQLQRNSDVASAVMAHPFTRVVFRVGDEDARKLSEGFSFFEAQDFKNLETGQAIARVERSTFDFNLSVPCPGGLDEAETAKRRQEVITASRKKYGTPRTEVEAMLRKMWQEEDLDSKTAPKKLTSVPRPAAASQPSVLKAPVAEETKGSPRLNQATGQALVSEATPALLQPPALQPSPATIGEQHVAGKEADRITDSRKEANELVRVAIQAAVKPATTKEAPREPRTPKEQGKGGAQHTAIQKRIKEAAQSAGFFCTIETQLLRQQSVDIALEKDGQRIACEISITTTVDHEVHNVKKCLDAGFSKVMVICIEEGRLKKIQKAILGSLGADVAKRVGFFLPDEFIAELVSHRPGGSTTKVRGYKIKRTVAANSQEEQKQKEDVAIRLIAESLKKK